VILTSVALVKELMGKAKTSKGLKVVVEITEKVYLTGRKVAEDFKANMRFIFDTVLPRWNYRALLN
jgi:ribosomal protein L13